MPPVEVEVLMKRQAIPLDENEGIYVRDIKTGKVRRAFCVAVLYASCCSVPQLNALGGYPAHGEGVAVFFAVKLKLQKIKPNISILGLHLVVALMFMFMYRALSHAHICSCRGIQCIRNA